MSTELTREEVWGIQLMYCRAKGFQPPKNLDAESESILRDILGDDEVDSIKKQLEDSINEIDDVNNKV